MTRRAPDNQDLKIFALSVIVQKETGGNLVEIIEKIADTVRARYKFQGKLRGLTAEGRMSSYVLGALPFARAAVPDGRQPALLDAAVRRPSATTSSATRSSAGRSAFCGCGR